MPSLTTSLPFSPAELAYLHTSLSSIPPLRPDARPLATDFRPLRAETGVLPAVNGSAHVGFSDGREAIVGVKLEVEKTVTSKLVVSKSGDEDGAMAMDIHDNEQPLKQEGTNGVQETEKDQGKGGRPEWLTLTLTLPGLRDDDPNLVFLEEMLREPLAISGLQEQLVINHRWHWHVYVDVLLVSPLGLASHPLPLLSMAVHLALRDARAPRLKSEGEEDPVADDDWMASASLYEPAGKRPPVTLLVVVVGENVIFDPSREELAVADGVVAVSVGSTATSGGETEEKSAEENVEEEEYKILAVRMIDTPARDTMRGVPMSDEGGEGADVPGVWKPRVGGIKRAVLKTVAKSVIQGGVARDVMAGLNGFLDVETNGAAS